MRRFYVFHFFFSLLFFPLISGHILILHLLGSTAPLGAESGLAKICFFPLMFLFDLEILFGLILFYGFIAGIGGVSLVEEYENFNEADSILAPLHIQPEWYFLHAYAILRCVPNKRGGVIILVRRVLVIFILAYKYKICVSLLKRYSKKVNLYLLSARTIGLM